MGYDAFEAVSVDGSGDEFLLFRDGMDLVRRRRRRKVVLVGTWFFGVTVRGDFLVCRVPGDALSVFSCLLQVLSGHVEGECCYSRC